MREKGPGGGHDAERGGAVPGPADRAGVRRNGPAGENGLNMGSGGHRAAAFLSILSLAETCMYIYIIMRIFHINMYPMMERTGKKPGIPT